MAGRFMGVVLTVAVAMGGACSVNSIDSVKSKQLDLCQKIKDEALRVKCITDVGRTK